MTVQGIVDIYNTRDYDKMTEEIDKIEEFWANLASDLEGYQDHKHDFDLYSGMVCQYNLVKDYSAESKESEMLKEFAKWLKADFDILDIDIKDYDFKNAIDDYLDTKY